MQKSFFILGLFLLNLQYGGAQTADTVEQNCETDFIIGDVSLKTYHELHAQYIYELQVMSAKAQGLFDADLDVCFSLCQTDYREGIRSCTLSTIASEDATPEYAVPFAICVHYQHDRYRACLDPHKECKVRRG